MDLEKDGYTFLGWSKTQGAAEADFDASLPVTDDLTLYAVFKKNVAPPAPGKTRVTARPFAVAMPMRTPVKDPGPRPTSTWSTSAIASLAFASVSSAVAVSSTLARRRQR